MILPRRFVCTSLSIFLLFVVGLSSEDLDLAIFNNHSAPMFLIDPVNGHILKANTAASKVYGYASFAGFKISDLNTASQEQIQAEMGRAVEQKRNYFSFIHKKSDNTLFPVEVWSSPVLLDGKSYLVSLIHDVSEKKKLEAALAQERNVFSLLISLLLLFQAVFIIILIVKNKKEKHLYKQLEDRNRQIERGETRLSALFSAMTEIVALHRVIRDSNNEIIDYRLLSCNKAFCELTKKQLNDIEGKKASEFYASSPPPFLEEYARVVQTGTPTQFSTYYQGLDKYFNISCICYETDCFATVSSDITDVKQQASIIETKNREMETFLYVGSHDLRTPLVNIQGFTSRIAGDILTLSSLLPEIASGNAGSLNEAKELLEQRMPKSQSFIVKAIERMDGLIRGLLTISRTGRAELDYEMLDLEALANDLALSNSFVLQELGGSIKIGSLVPAWGDKLLIRQVFENLVGNAIKYRKQGIPPRIEINSFSDGLVSVYQIQDWGIGISDADLPRIWDVFYRVSPQASESGDGIGLALVRTIIEKHGGSVRVESELGAWTRFTLRLPAQAGLSAHITRKESK